MLYIRIFENWQSGRENTAVICENNPFSLEIVVYVNCVGIIL